MGGITSILGNNGMGRRGLGDWIERERVEGVVFEMGGRGRGMWGWWVGGWWIRGVGEEDRR